MASEPGSDDSSGDNSVLALDENTVASISLTVRTNNRRPTSTENLDTRLPGNGMMTINLAGKQQQQQQQQPDSEGNLVPRGRLKEAVIKEYHYKVAGRGQCSQEVMNTLKDATVLSLTTPLLRRMLIKSLSNEVKCLYCVLELDDALHLIEKHNSDPEREGINMIVLELDRSTQNNAVRLMETLRSRGEHTVKRQTHLIPVMMLLHSDVDVEEPLADCMEMGLAGYLEESMTKKDYLKFFLGNVVQRYRDLHTSYQTVRNLRVFKYPYFELSDVQGEDAAAIRKQAKKRDGDDSTVSGESWTVGSDLMDRGNEGQVYKHQGLTAGAKEARRSQRGSKYLVEVIKHKVMPTLHFSHLYELSDPKARPKIYKNLADGTKMTGLPTDTKMKGALVSPEMEFFVQKAKPQGDLYRSARGHQVTKLQRAAFFRDPWAVATAEREESFNVTEKLIASNDVGVLASPRGLGPPQAHGKRRDFREMADEENQLARHQRSPSRDGFPGVIASQDYKAIKEAGQSAAVNDILQFDLIVPEPQVVTSNAVNSFVIRGFKCHVANELMRALSYYTYAIQVEPSATGYFYRGVVYDALGEHIKALSDFNSCRKYNSQKPEFEDQLILYNRAVVSSKLGMDRYSLADLFKATNLEKSEVIFLTNRAMIHRRHGQFYAACEQYQKLWSLQTEGLQQLAARKNAKAAVIRAKREAKDQEHEQKMAAYAASGAHIHQAYTLWACLASNCHVITAAQRTLHFRTARLTGALDSSYADLDSVELGSSGQGSRTQELNKCTTRFNPVVTTRIVGTSIHGDNSTLAEAKPSVFSATTRRSSFSSTQKTVKIKGWKTQKLVLGAGDGDELGRLLDGSPMETGPLQAWASKTVRLSKEAQQNEAHARSEWQAIIQNRTTMFEGFCCKPSDLQEALGRLPTERKEGHIDTITTALRMFPMLMDVPDKVIREVAKVVEYRLVQEGKHIAVHGHAPDCCFFLLTGKVIVKLHNAEETNVQAYTLESYDSFGEMAMVDPQHQFYLESYLSDAHCEIMLVLKSDFDRLLHRYVFERLKLRYIALKKLRIFQGWSMNDLTRLARMSHVRSCPADTVILKQTEQPNYLYVLLRGAVVVSKVPSRYAELQHQKRSIEQQVTRIRTKYAFHHSIRPPGTKKASQPNREKRTSDVSTARGVAGMTTRRSGSNGGDKPQPKQGTKATPDAKPEVKKVAPIGPWLTPTEQKKRDLLRELAKVNEELRSLGFTEGEGETVAATLNHSAHTSPVGDVQVRTLTPPALFGEECVLDPHMGLALGSFTAETRVELMYIHKVVIQTFRIQDSFLSRLQLKATVYPPNDQIVADDNNRKWWKAFREEMLLYAKKERWPVAKTRLRHAPGGKSYVSDDTGQECVFTKFIA